MSTPSRKPLTGASFDTLAVHAGEAADPATRAHNTPIYQTATFSFETAEAKDEAVGHPWDAGSFFYSRVGNPTTAALEAKLAALDGGEAAVASATGMSAIAATLLSHLRAGQHLVVADDLFIGTQDLLSQDLPRLGIEVTAVPITDLDAVRAAVRPHTGAIFAEVLSNPWMRVTDVPALRTIADAAGALLVIDNTFLSPAVVRPLALGADLVVHATTKWVAGHGDALGGVVVGPEEKVAPVRVLTNNMGAAASPFNSWLIARGARTLHLRLERASANATKLAAFLEAHPKVDWVHHPSLASHPDQAVAQRVLTGLPGGMMAVKLLPGGSADAVEAMHNFANAFRTFGLAVSLGEVDTLVYPMASRGGIVRVSVGVESADDIIAEFSHSLDQVP